MFIFPRPSLSSQNKFTVPEKIPPKFSLKNLKIFFGSPIKIGKKIDQTLCLWPEWPFKAWAAPSPVYFPEFVAHSCYKLYTQLMHVAKRRTWAKGDNVKCNFLAEVKTSYTSVRVRRASFITNERAQKVCTFFYTSSNKIIKPKNHVVMFTTLFFFLFYLI